MTETRDTDKASEQTGERTGERITEAESVITAEQFLKHWQGHRLLSRRMIEAFPDDQLFTFSIGGMRTFGQLAGEMLVMAGPSLQGVVTGEWKEYEKPRPTTKRELLEAWDAETQRIDELWPMIPAGRFQEKDVAFGQWPGTMSWLLRYILENEVHHRGQGYVYLRALDIEPPAFWDRPE